MSALEIVLCSCSIAALAASFQKTAWQKDRRTLVVVTFSAVFALTFAYLWFFGATLDFEPAVVH